MATTEFQFMFSTVAAQLTLYNKTLLLKYGIQEGACQFILGFLRTSGDLLTVRCPFRLAQHLPRGRGEDAIVTSAGFPRGSRF